MGAVRLALLVEEQEALAGLRCPGNDGVCDLRLLAAKVEVEVLWLDGLVAQPELLLARDERPFVGVSGCCLGAVLMTRLT